MKTIKLILIVYFFFTLDIFALSAKEIARKSYNVNHSLYVKNMMIKRYKRSSILSISRSLGRKPKITAIERFLSNEYNNGIIEAKDLIIIRSGKLNGVGILMTSYLDPKRSHEYLMWIPALRKVRRMAEPKDAGLGTGDIAFLEDAKLRRFHEETYTLLNTKVMNLKLLMMPFKKGELGRYEKKLPYKKTTKINGRKIYVVKSTFKKKYHWYDYRISYIDSEYFTDYITFYYKNKKRIKEVYRHWIHLGELLDPKAKMWYYWYSKDNKTKYEMITYIPKRLIKVDKKTRKSFWSTKTLQKIKR